MERDGLVYVVEPYDLGSVVLPTGKVVGCDPLIAHTTPYVDAVQPGRYALRAWVAVMHADGGERQRRIAALQLVVADMPAESWAMALLPGQDLASLGADEFFGYGVGAGTATLADQVAIEVLNDWDYDQLDEVFVPAQIPEDPIEAVIGAVVDESTMANVYVVGAGWGDGRYATYVGRAGNGQITTFVTDFRVVPLA